MRTTLLACVLLSEAILPCRSFLLRGPSHLPRTSLHHKALRLSGGSASRSSVSLSARSLSANAEMAKNVLGGELQCCCTSPKTGFYRDGFCNTGPQDTGRHVVCAQVSDMFHLCRAISYFLQVTAEFLNFSKSRGNDLMVILKAPAVHPLASTLAPLTSSRDR